MSIFKKLLVILLTVALPPLIFISSLDQKAMKALSRELIADHRDAQVEQAENELRQLLDANNRLLTLERRALELALLEQSENPWRSFRDRPLKGVGGVLRRYTLFSGGASTAVPEDAAPQSAPWLSAARASGEPVWTVRDGSALVLAMQTRDGDGVTAIEVSTRDILDRLALSEDWRSAGTVHLVEAGSGRVLARTGADFALPRENLDGPPGVFRFEAAGERKEDESETKETEERSGYLLGRVPAGTDELLLAVALPLDHVLTRAAHSEARAAHRLQRQVTIGGTSVVVFALIAIILSFIGSRSITKPVQKLTETARRIADGDLKARADVETGDELEDLSDSFNAMLPKLQDRFKMREALSLAMEVQQHLLPAEPPMLEGFDIAGRSIYCDETGGDYYDFIEFSDLEDCCVGVAVGDVTGHGVAAALLMTTARALLRSHAGNPGSLADLMTAINRHLSEDAHAGRFMTLFYGTLDTRNRSFRWVSAGHEPAMLFEPETGTFRELPGHDIPLGIDGTWCYQEDVRDHWRKGEIVIIGTDGIWESRNPAGRMFGKEAFQEVIRKYADKSADDICDAVARTVRSFRQDQAQQDDITLVVIKALA